MDAANLLRLHFRAPRPLSSTTGGVSGAGGKGGSATLVKTSGGLKAEGGNRRKNSGKKGAAAAAAAATAEASDVPGLTKKEKKALEAQLVRVRVLSVLGCMGGSVFYTKYSIPRWALSSDIDRISFVVRVRNNVSVPK